MRKQIPYDIYAPPDLILVDAIILKSDWSYEMISVIETLPVSLLDKSSSRSTSSNISSSSSSSISSSSSSGNSSASSSRPRVLIRLLVVLLVLLAYKYRQYY